MTEPSHPAGDLPAVVRRCAAASSSAPRSPASPRSSPWPALPTCGRCSSSPCSSPRSSSSSSAACVVAGWLGLFFVNLLRASPRRRRRTPCARRRRHGAVRRRRPRSWAACSAAAPRPGGARRRRRSATVSPGLYNYGTFVDYLHNEVTKTDRYGGQPHPAHARPRPLQALQRPSRPRGRQRAAAARSAPRCEAWSARPTWRRATAARSSPCSSAATSPRATSSPSALRRAVEDLAVDLCAAAATPAPPCRSGVASYPAAATDETRADRACRRGAVRVEAPRPQPGDDRHAGDDRRPTGGDAERVRRAAGRRRRALSA